MSLQVWLPLNGDLHNQGLSNIVFTNTGVNIDDNGKIGKCYHFNADQYIKESTYDWTNFNTSEFSLCCWYKEPSPVASGNSQIICIGTSSGWNNIRIGLLRRTSNGYPMFSVSNGSTAIQYNFTASSFTLDTWNHIVVTYNNGELKMYLNGTLNKTSTTTIVPVLNSSQHLGIGAASNGAEKLTGFLNDVRIYDHCLSAKEVEEISKGLILHYKLDNNGQGQYNLLKDTNKGNYRWIAPSGNGTGTVTSISIDGTNCARYEMTVKSTNWCVFAFRPTNNIEVMDTLHEINSYTLSFDIFPSQPINNAIPRYVDGNAQNNLINWPSFSAPANAWYHYEGTAISSGATQSNQSFYINYLFDIGTYDFKNLKIEIGAKATGYNTHSEESFLSNIIYDSSGYQNNGDSTNISFISNTPRYNTATQIHGTTVDNSSNTKVGSAYIRGFISLTTPSALTVTWWGKNTAYGRGGIFQTSVNSDPSECTDYNTTAIANWDSTFRIYNGNTAVNFFNSFVKDDTWHYHTITFDGNTAKYYLDGNQKINSALTGTLPTFNGFCLGLGKAGGVYRQIKESISDFRIYCTALTEKQIKELYDTSATVDKNGNIYTREAIEL